MRSWDRRLSLIGIAALVAYVLACRPAFSPDGSKILVTVAGGTNEQGQVVVYDRKAEKWTSLLTISKSLGGDGTPIPTALWSADGKEVVAVWASGDETILVSVLPVGGSGPTRLFQVDGLEEAYASVMVPPVLQGRRLLLGGDSITVLDLESGAMERRELGGEGVTNASGRAIYLAGQGKEVGYLLGTDETVEVGRMDMKSLRLEPGLQLPAGKEDGNPFFALSRTGSRLALTLGDADNQRLVIYRRLQRELTIPFGVTNNGVVLGNLIWSADGQQIYAAGFRPLKPGPIAKAMHAGYEALRAAGFRPAEPRTLNLQVSVFEIPLDGAPLRETRLFRIATSNDETFRMFYQIALSPDGKTVAASAGLGWEDQATREGDRALYLLDLSRAGRPVKKIQIPRSTVVPGH